MATVKPEVLKADALEDHASADDKELGMSIEYMRDYYAKQPKVSVRLAEDTWLQVNGYTVIIKGGERVQVAQGIADELEAVGKI